MKTRIDLVFRLLSPFSSAAPGTAHYDFNKPGFGNSGFPCTRTARIPIATTQAMAEEASDGERKNYHREYPVIPVNTLRGLLRRCAAEIISDTLVERGEQVSLEVFHILTCGAHSAAPNKVNSLKIMRDSLSHPYLGLFGGGPQMSPSSFTISNGLPIISDLVESGFVPDFLSEFQPAASGGGLSRVSHFRHVDDVLNLRSSDPLSFIKDFDRDVKAWIDSIADNKDERKKNKEDGGSAKKSDLSNMACIEFVIPGICFHSEISFDHRGPGKPGLGLLLQSLDRLRTRTIGGKTLNGFGKFEMVGYLQSGDKRISLFDSNGDLNLNETEVSEALDAYATASADLTASSLEAAFSLDKPAKK